MRETKEITLKIYCDKEEEFYLSLLKSKASEKPDIEIWKGIIDAIHFETELISEGFELNESQKKEILNNLVSIHQFLIASKDNSPHYLTVGKSNFEQFKTSSFGLGLFKIFKELEILKRWSGKENDVEVKSGIGLFSTEIKGIGEVIADSLGRSLNKIFALSEILNNEIGISTNKKGNLIIKFGKEEEKIELQLYVETHGKITRLNLNKGMENIPELDSTNSYYLYRENRAFQIKMEADKIQTTYFENVSLMNKDLDISKAIVTQTSTQDLNETSLGNISEKDGIFIIHPNESTTNDSIGYINPSFKIKTDVPKNIHNGIDSENSVFNPLEKIITPLLKIPTKKSEEVKNRENTITKIYHLLKNIYPEISPYAAAIITGYSVSLLGLLDSEEKYENSKRNDPYLKYLKNSVYKAVKKNPTIKHFHSGF